MTTSSTSENNILSIFEFITMHIGIKTNEYNNKMIDLIGYSHKDVINILKLLDIDYTLEGTGYVYEQSIPPDGDINETLVLKLQNKY